MSTFLLVMPDSRLDRRQFCLSLASAAAGLALVTPRSAGAQDPSPPQASTPRGKLLILGDSMIAGGFGLYLEQKLRKTHAYEAVREGKSSTGLARPDFYNWIDKGAKLVEAHKPGAVVCMFGGNDGQGLFMGRKVKPKWIRWQEEGWTQEYRRRVNAFADAVTPQGQTLFWIGMPVMKPTKLHARVQHMNTIFRGEMAIRRNAHFLDVWRALSPDGAYTDYVDIEGTRTKVRAGDGVHLSRNGAHYLVAQVAPQIASAFSAQDCPSHPA